MTDILFVPLTLICFGVAHLYIVACDKLNAKVKAPVIENGIILTLSIALLAYLVYAMLRPEKF